MTTHWNHTKHPDAPLRWRNPRQVRVTLTGAETDTELDRIFAVMALATAHTFEVLAANVDRMKEWADYARKFDNTDEEISDLNLKINGDWSTPVHLSEGGAIPNVAIGTTCRTQAEVDHAVPLLLNMPNAGPWLRLEPSERISVDFDSDVCHCGDLIKDHRAYGSCPGPLPMRDSYLRQGLHYIELAGQTGPDAQPLHPQWARQIRDDCAAANVPFRFESWGKWAPYGIGKGQKIGSKKRTILDMSGDAMIDVGPRRSGRTLDSVEHDGQIN